MSEQGYKEFVKRFEDVCTQYVDKTAITYMRDDGSKTLFTFGEIYNRVKAAKEQFAAVGLRPGDRAAIIAPHSPFAVIAGLSLAYSNITSVLIDASLPGEEINRLLEFSDVRAVFTVSLAYETLDNIQRGQHRFKSLLNQYRVDCGYDISSRFTIQPCCRVLQLATVYSDWMRDRDD